MRYLTVQDLMNLCSTRANGKITETLMNHWFVMYGRNEPEPETQTENTENS